MVSQTLRFNSRSPSGLRHPAGPQTSFVATFQFTQPKRAATCIWSAKRNESGTFQFTQPKRAATVKQYGDCANHDVSIHAAQAGCDQVRRAYHPTKRAFQFTQPKRAATGEYLTAALSFTVSIHAAQAGCDPMSLCLISSTTTFQFTQPKRAATLGRSFESSVDCVSIHAAQAGCDGCCKDTTKKRFSQRINRESPYQ